MDHDDSLRLARFVGFGLSVAVIILLCLLFRRYYGGLSLAAVQSALKAMSWRGGLLYIAGFTLGIIFFVPSLPMGVVGALAFGPWWGFFVLEAGSLAAAAAIFGMVRLWLKPLLGERFFQTLLPGRLRTKLNNKVFLLIVYARTFKVPAAAINYGASALKVDFGEFMLASLLGSLPNNLALALLCGVAHDALLEGRWLALLQWELVPALLLAVFNLVVAHYLHVRLGAGDEVPAE